VSIEVARVNVVATTPATEVYSIRVGGRGRRLTLKNLGSVEVDLGGSGVTTGAGYKLDAGAVVEMTLSSGDVLYGIASSGTQSVQVLSTSL
jgi:hypothetical protein